MPMPRSIERSENPWGWGGQYQCDGHKMPPLVGIGLTELPYPGGAKVPPAPPLMTAL